jgi:hypothetical protein
MVCKGSTAKQTLNVPPNVLSGGAHAGSFAIKMVMIRKVRQQ